MSNLINNEKILNYKLLIIVFMLLLWTIQSLIGNDKILYLIYFLFLIFITIVYRFSLSKEFVSSISLLLFPLFVPLLLDISNFSYISVQSLFYLSIPLISLFLGFVLTKVIKSGKFLRVIVIASVLNSCLYVIVGFNYLGLNFILNSYEIRDLFIWSSSLQIISLCILFFGKDLVYFKARRLYLLILILHLFLLQSRTYLLMFIFSILYFLYKGYKKKFFLFLGLCISIIQFLIIVLPNNKFISKISDGPREAFFITEFNTDEDINTYYRAFETYSVFLDFRNSDMQTKILGHDLSSVLRLDTFVKLGEDYRDEIPIFHNGYAYLLYRLGLVGFLFWMLFFLNLLRKKQFLNQVFLFNLKVVSVILLLLSNFFVASFFSIEFISLWIVLGYVNFLKFPLERNYTVVYE
jgi:hypothetical protein